MTDINSTKQSAPEEETVPYDKLWYLVFNNETRTSKVGRLVQLGLEKGSTVSDLIINDKLQSECNHNKLSLFRGPLDPEVDGREYKEPTCSEGNFIEDECDLSEIAPSMCYTRSTSRGKQCFYIVLQQVTEEKLFSSNKVLNTQRGNFKLKNYNSNNSSIKPFTFRGPQEQALLKAKTAFDEDTNESKSFLAVLPTGVGKTSVLCVAPFVLDANKVLVITPNCVLHQQVLGELRKFYSKDHAFGRSFGVHGLSVQVHNVADAAQAHIVVTHVQEIADRKGNSPDRLNILLKKFQPDLVIVDEGHHQLAQSYQELKKKFLEKNKSCNFVLLTATPERGDNKCYGIEKNNFYVYRRNDARIDGYIKATRCHPINIHGHGEEAKDKDYVLAMMKPALAKLKEQRISTGLPMRMLVTTKTKADAVAVVDILKKEEDFAEFKFDCVVGGAEKIKEKIDLFKPIEESCDSIDVMVQCKMLGEGYDNCLISVSVLLAPPKQVHTLAQIHGRSLRKPPDSGNSTQRMESHLFYPNKENVNKIIESYMNGDDENESFLNGDTILDEFKDFNHMCRKKRTNEVKDELVKNFDKYHDLYTEVRDGWQSIPAEALAEKVFNSFILDKDNVELRIIDFGCGRDFLFENKLFELVEGRASNLKGNVTVLTCDVASCEDIRPPTFDDSKMATKFKMNYIQGSYHDLEPPENMEADVGVFCLSLMGIDSLEQGLQAASRMVKPKAPIHIVEPGYNVIKYQYPLVKKEQGRFECVKTAFHEDTNNQFPVVKLEPLDKMFVHAELINVDREHVREGDLNLYGLKWNLGKPSKRAQNSDNEIDEPKPSTNNKRDDVNLTNSSRSDVTNKAINRSTEAIKNNSHNNTLNGTPGVTNENNQKNKIYIDSDEIDDIEEGHKVKRLYIN